MDPLDEISKLCVLDPGGWRCEYGYHSRLASLSYANKIVIKIDYLYPYSQSGSRNITIFPGGFTLGWWGRRRFDKLVQQLAGRVAQGAAHEVAQRLVQARSDELERAMRELDEGLASQFAALEEADRKERDKLAESPVANGFFKGAMRQLGGRK